MLQPFVLEGTTVQPGTRAHFELPIMKRPDATTLGIPLIILHGARPGPRLFVSGAVHGDEVEGTAAIIDVVNSLDASLLAGTFIGAPVVSVAAFLGKSSIDVSGIRENPIDWKNLARTYPGRADGTATERIADAICNRIFPLVSYAIDLHSGGTRGTSVHLAGFVGVEDGIDETSLELARLFPIETLWRVSPWAKIAEAATKKGVSLVVCESTGQGRADDSDVQTYVTGIKNIMKHLGMIEGQPESLPATRRFIDSETYLYANIGGFLRPHVKTGEFINEGQLLGIVQDVYGTTVEEVCSPLEGVVTGIRTKPVVWAGEPTFLVANFLPDPTKAGISKTRVAGHITPP